MLVAVGDVAPITAPLPVILENAAIVNCPPLAASVCKCPALTNEAIVGVVRVLLLNVCALFKFATTLLVPASPYRRVLVTVSYAIEPVIVGVPFAN